MKHLIEELNQRYEKVKLGGGKKRIEAHKAKGKLTARERIDYLVDANTEQIEIGAFAGNEMYEADGGCVGGGVVVVMAYVSKRLCVIVSNDATVKAGAWFPITAKKYYELKKLRWKIAYQSSI